MIDYKILITNPEKFTFFDRLNNLDRSMLHVNHSKKYISIGCDMKSMNHLIGVESVFPYYKKFKNMEELYERDTESLLTHEYIHVLLRKINPWANECFDDIDQNNEISGFMILGAEQ